ncbi:hypothetical protein DFQ11_10689 [Winogradskyella epiphytica]|uniref:Uncharacterized protein n=1 Tax=Winogradskyella epiphytica TaxID=262005 RepID=A0A2V4XD49_9FLAO|nr:hypothetical protein [Winogradskyella epiphytica]PYE80289.1 hypothetical protein DFQ11_10689 [Winogradskyella epiphytica]GGW70319.1 hypothetical protein GCM10008085_22910 [Winogradskyella epiphytica]
MDIDQIIQLLFNLAPTLVVGVIAYYFFKQHIVNENNRRRFMIQQDLQKNAFPLRLQAYERMTLFLERISPSKLLTRVNPISSSKEDYEALLIANIEQEFEHNLAQQIYVSDQCWSITQAAKNATIQMIRKATSQEDTDTANKLREVVLKELMNKPAPSNAALAFIKQEVSEMW